jgi:hypothetical protein
MNLEHVINEKIRKYAESHTGIKPNVIVLSEELYRELKLTPHFNVFGDKYIGMIVCKTDQLMPINGKELICSPIDKGFIRVGFIE